MICYARHVLIAEGKLPNSGVPLISASQLIVFTNGDVRPIAMGDFVEKPSAYKRIRPSLLILLHCSMALLTQEEQSCYNISCPATAGRKSSFVYA